MHRSFVNDLRDVQASSLAVVFFLLFSRRGTTSTRRTARFKELGRNGCGGRTGIDGRQLDVCAP